MSEFNSRNRSRRFSPSSRRKINFDQLRPRQFDGDNDLTSDLNESSSQGSRRNEDLSAVEDKLFGRPQRRSSNELESLLEGGGNVGNEESKLQELSIAARLRALINSRTFESLPSRRKEEIREYVMNALNALESGQAEYPQFTKGILNNIFVDDQIAKSSDYKDNLQCRSNTNPKALESLKLFIDELQKSDIGKDCSRGISLNEIFKKDKPLFSDELLLLMIDNAMKRLKEKQNEVPLFSEDEAKIIIREELRKRNYFTTDAGEIIPGNNYPLTVDDLLNSQFNFESNKGFLLNLARFIANERLPEEGERSSLSKFLSDERGGVDGFDGGDVDLDRFSTSDLLKLRGAEYARLIESQNTTKGEASGTIRFLLDKIRREYETEDLDIFRQSIDNVEKLYTMIVQKTIEKYLDNESVSITGKGFTSQGLNYVAQILLPVYLEIQILDSFEAKQRYYRQYYKLTDDKINEIIQFFADRRTSSKKELFNSVISLFARVMRNGINPLEDQLNEVLSDYGKSITIRQINEVVVNMTIFNQSGTSDGRLLIFLSNERLFFSPELLKFKKESKLINIDTLIKMFAPDEYLAKGYKTVIGAISFPIPGVPGFAGSSGFESEESNRYIPPSSGSASIPPSSVTPPIPFRSSEDVVSSVKPLTSGLLFSDSSIPSFSPPVSIVTKTGHVNNVALVIQDHAGNPIEQLSVDFRQIILLSVLLNVSECIANFYSDKVYSPDYAKVIRRLFHKVRLELDSEEDIVVVSVLDKLNTIFNVMYHERAIPYAKILNKCFNRLEIRTSEFGGVSQLNDGFIIDTSRMLLKEAILNIPTEYTDAESRPVPTDNTQFQLRMNNILRSVYLSFVQSNNLLNDVDKTLRGVYSDIFRDPKKLNDELFRDRINFSLTLKLYSESLFFISTRLLRFYLYSALQQLTNFPLNRAVGATGIVTTDNTFVPSGIIEKANQMSQYVASLYKKLHNNESYIRITVDYLKQFQSSKKGTKQQEEIVQEVLDDFSELHYDKIYYDVAAPYLGRQTNFKEGIAIELSETVSRRTESLVPGSVPAFNIQNGFNDAINVALLVPSVRNVYNSIVNNRSNSSEEIETNYIKFLLSGSPVSSNRSLSRAPVTVTVPSVSSIFTHADKLLALNINSRATQADVDSAVRALNSLINNLNIAGNYLPNITNQTSRQVLLNLNYYLIVLSYMAKNILQIRYFYHKLSL
jgi:hypothetical protein